MGMTISNVNATCASMGSVIGASMLAAMYTAVGKTRYLTA